MRPQDRTILLRSTSAKWGTGRLHLAEMLPSFVISSFALFFYFQLAFNSWTFRETSLALPPLAKAPTDSTAGLSLPDSA